MRTSLGCLSGAAVVLGLALALHAQAPAVPAPDSITSMVVNADGAQRTLYVADPNVGLYTATWQGAPPEFIRYDTLTRADVGTEIDRPAALALTQDRLFLLDASTLRSWPSIGRKTVDNLRSVQIEDVSRPMGLAAAPDGTVFFGDADSRSVRRVGTDARVQTIATELDPTSLSVVGRELQVFDRSAASVYFVLQQQSTANAVRKLPTFETSSVHGVLTGVTSAINLNGVYYLASPQGVLVQSAGRPAPLSLTVAPTSALAVTDDYVFAAEAEGIHAVPRAVPATFTISGQGDTPTDSTLSVLAYLAQRGLLRGEAVDVDVFSSFRDLLVAHQRLPLTTSTGTKSTVESRIVQLLCRLEGRGVPACAAKTALDTAVRVVVPQPTLTTELRLEPVNLGGKSVTQYLDERVPSPRDRAEITADYLLSVNRASTLELAFMKPELRFTLAAPARDNLQPGMMIIQSRAREYPRNTLSAYCGIDITPTRRPVEVPPTLSTREVSAYLPRTLPFTRVPVLPGVDSVEVNFGDATIEELPIDRVRTAVLTPAARECLRPYMANDFVRSGRDSDEIITSSLKVQGATFRFLAANGKPAALTANDLDSRDFLGTFDAKTQSLQYGGPLYIGYKSTAWSAFTEGRLDNASVDVRTSQNIMQLRRGRVLLPATVWELAALVPVKDVRDQNSRLSQMRRNRDTIRVSVAGSGAPAPQAAGDDEANAVVRPAPAEVAANRAHLFETIAYNTALASVREPPMIAVAERGLSVNYFHPDFLDTATQSAWQELTGQKSHVPKTRTPVEAASAPPPSIGQFSVEGDHGTHVGGIIGSRLNSPAPGLIPSVELFLLDTTDLSNFPANLAKLYARLLITFSFSNKMSGTNIRCDKQCITDAKDAVAGTLDTAVYVVAAGNGDGLLSKKDGTFPPIGWLADFPNNMIGVAATTADGTQLLATKDSQGLPIEPSNWGPLFVQLAAPGQSIFGPLATAGTYGRASGTSMAVPQVAAAVELLRRSEWGRSLTPAQVKARLIYTTKWEPKLAGKVWGGLLDVRRVLLPPGDSVFSNHTEPDRLFRITWDSDAELPVAPSPVGIMYPASADPRRILFPSSSINLAQLLRIEFVPKTHWYRIIYLDSANSNMLTIAHQIRLTGMVKCKTLEEWNEAAHSFQPSTYYRNCEIPVQQIRDYVAKVPNLVPRFPN